MEELDSNQDSWTPESLFSVPAFLVVMSLSGPFTATLIRCVSNRGEGGPLKSHSLLCIASLGMILSDLCCWALGNVKQEMEELVESRNGALALPG